MHVWSLYSPDIVDFQDAKRTIVHSVPDLQEGEETANVNIFGAPCDVDPPFTQTELEQNYLGCQNLPSALWVMKMLQSSQKLSQIEGDSEVES